MDFKKFNEDFERRKMEEKVKKRTGEINAFLKNKGFQPFTSDGTHFFDAEGREYADHGLAFLFKRKEGGIEKTYETNLGDIHPEKDLFNLLYTPSTDYDYAHTPTNISFVGSRVPSSPEYGGFFLFNGVSWYVNAIDGNFRQAIHPVLMLRNSIKPSNF